MKHNCQYTSTHPRAAAGGSLALTCIGSSMIGRSSAYLHTLNKQFVHCRRFCGLKGLPQGVKTFEEPEEYIAKELATLEMIFVEVRLQLFDAIFTRELGRDLDTI
jgi:hypothetical protein